MHKNCLDNTDLWNVTTTTITDIDIQYRYNIITSTVNTVHICHSYCMIAGRAKWAFKNRHYLLPKLD